MQTPTSLTQSYMSLVASVSSRSTPHHYLLPLLFALAILACISVALLTLRRRLTNSSQLCKSLHMQQSSRNRRTKPSVSEISAAAIASHSFHNPRAPLIRPLAKFVHLIKHLLWDSFLFPLLAWALNIVSVLFALLVAFIPALISLRQNKLKVCVATSLPANSTSCPPHAHQAEATQLNKGKPTPPLSPCFSALMVPAALSCKQSRKSLVLDLDETLVHSQFTNTQYCDLRLEVRVDQFPAVFYVSKRPYLDVFLRTVAQWYDVVIFTASLQKYADPLISVLDTDHVVKRRIFRQDCIRRHGYFVKDLTIVNPNLANVLIVDNSPAAYSMQPSNAVPIEAWYHDQNDEELLNLLPLLHAIAFLNDVRSLLDLRLTGGALAARRTRRTTR